MRLIEADKLLKDLDSSPFVKYAVDSLIEEQPTVDAIPVEWINRWYDRNYMYSDVEIGDLLNDWKEAQKEGDLS